MVRIPSSPRATSSRSASSRCSHVPSQGKCLGRVKLVLLVLVFVEVFPWVEAEAGSLDHPAPVETAFLVLLGRVDRHHISRARA